MTIKQTVALLIILALGAGGLLAYRANQSEPEPDSSQSPPERESEKNEEESASEERSSEETQGSREDLYADVPAEERDAVKAWIKANNRNRYGDPQDTVYTGGTPLFNEETGERISLYTYLLDNHPDKPWLSDASESEEERTEPIPFSQVDSWDRYRGARYSIEYPTDPNVVSANANDKQRGEIDVRFTNGNDFTLEVVSQAKAATVSQCTKKSRFNRTICHNEATKYQDIYQRMMDSMRKIRL